MTDTARLLWTGGWDSTFRLLQLLLVEGRAVEPHYIIGDRLSVYYEFRSMRQIKQRFSVQHPDRRDLFRPIRYCNKLDIPAVPLISEAFKAVREQRFLGDQYVLLARYARHASLDSLELCIHRDDKAHAVIAPFVKRRPAAVHGYECDQALCGQNEYVLFGAFRFPVFDLTKLEMKRIADERGFGEYMALTWFCHKPTWGGGPCGVCNPCRYAIEEGLASRVPLRGRLWYPVRRCLQAARRRVLQICHRGRPANSETGPAGDI